MQHNYRNQNPSTSSLQTLIKSSSEQQAIFNAYQSEQKISDFTGKMDNDLDQCLLQWSNLLAVEPDSDEFNTVKMWLPVAFPQLTITDLQYAIMLFVSRKLEAKESDYDFPKMAPLYIGKIVSLYLHYRKNLIHDSLQKVKRLESQIEYKPSEKERINSFRAVLVIAFKENMAGKYYDDPGSIVYDFVRANNLIEFTTKLITDAVAYGQAKSGIDLKRKEKKQKQQILTAGAAANTVFDLSHEENKKKYSRMFVVSEWLKYVYSKVDKVTKKQVDSFVISIKDSYPSIVDFKPEQLITHCLTYERNKVIDSFLDTITIDMLDKKAEPIKKEKEEKIIPALCINCSMHVVKPDPDPEDFAGKYDVKVYCKHHSKNVAIACRPDNLETESKRPDWCEFYK